MTSQPDIKACPRCGRAIRDDNPLSRIATSPSHIAVEAWKTAVDRGLTSPDGPQPRAHDCDRYLAWAHDGEVAWSSDWPGYTGPPDMTTNPALRDGSYWVQAPARAVIDLLGNEVAAALSRGTR